MLTLERAGSPKLYEVKARNDLWLAQQQAGPLGRALEDLRRIMSEMEGAAAEDGTDATIEARRRLARDVQQNCNP